MPNKVQASSKMKKGGKSKASFDVNRKKKQVQQQPNQNQTEPTDPQWKKIQRRRGKPLFPLDSVPKNLLEKHTRGDGIEDDIVKSIKNSKFRSKTLTQEQKVKYSEEIAARTELLLTEQSGSLYASEGEVTKRFTQKQIASNVDITSASKYFELNLDFGPYRVDYTKNGRHLLIGGRRGHVAAFDWVTKRLHCEINVMEEVKDVQWLHIETMFAVAQKNWVYIYDKQGVELHCLQKLNKILKMTFLPYHFLLVTASEDSKVSWLDVSIGEMVKTTCVNRGRLGALTYNPYNGVVCLGHQNGTVSMWTPNKNKPLVKMLCHNSPVSTLSIDQAGKYMATTSMNKQLKFWDIRKLDGPIKSFSMRGIPMDTSFSQTGGFALGFNNVVEVYKDWNVVNKKRSYLVHETLGVVENIEFCPYEDVLGIGTKTGFTSIIVPGAGEPNFDAFEANPMQTKSQRREAEVKSLLEKIQPEMIVLDPTQLLEVNVPGVKQRIETKIKVMNMKPPEINFTPRNKKRGNTARKARVKKIVKQDLKLAAVRQLSEAKSQILEEMGHSGSSHSAESKPKGTGALDRFRSNKQEES